MAYGEWNEEDWKNYQEYGTTDRKKIEEVKASKKEDNKASCFVIVLFFVIIPIVVGLFIKCMGGKGRAPWDDDSPWEPRHSQNCIEKMPSSCVV